jgi:hypothetical protein
MNINENYTLTLEVYIFFIFNMWMKNKCMHITAPNPFSQCLKSVHPKYSVQTIPSHLTNEGGPYLRHVSKMYFRKANIPTKLHSSVTLNFSREGLSSTYDGLRSYTGNLRPSELLCTQKKTKKSQRNMDSM